MTPLEQVQKWLEGDHLPDHDTFSGGREFWADVLDEITGRFSATDAAVATARAVLAEADAARLAAAMVATREPLATHQRRGALDLHAEARKIVGNGQVPDIQHLAYSAADVDLLVEHERRCIATWVDFQAVRHAGVGDFERAADLRRIGTAIKAGARLDVE